MTKLRFLVPAAFCLCMICDYCIARAHLPNADSVQNFNEIFAIWHGNIFLSHWILGVDNFYFTDLPFFIILSGIFGEQTWLLTAEPVLVYTLLLLAAVLLVMRASPPGAWRWRGALLVMLLIGVPLAAVQGKILLSPAIHIATCMLCLYALLIIQPSLSGRKLDKFWLPVFGMLVFAVAASDPLADALFIAPLLALILLRLWLNPAFRPDDWIIFSVTAMATCAGGFWPHFMTHNHGFSTVQNLLTGFVPDIAGIEANIHALRGALQVFFGARAESLQGIAGAGLLAATRLITLGLVLLFCLRVAWRAPRALDQAVAQLLVLGALGLGLAGIFSQNISAATVTGANFPGPAIRYFVPAFLFMAIASVIEAMNYFAAKHQAKLSMAAGSLAVLSGAVVIFAAGQVAIQAARQPAGITVAPQIIALKWLQAHHLTYGVGDYWTAQMITALSHGSVIADAVTGPGRLTLFPIVADRSRLDAGRQPQFVVTTQDNIFWVTLADVTATYGAPREVDQLGKFSIMILRNEDHTE